ncbi:MAG TPA: biotin--[acetyl-CoA-carboxylase] ligase, partial [Chroococcales cyanobacterium]
QSTNTRALELAAQGAAEGVIVLAHQQLAGRGRQGRVWHSPPGAGIYASFLLRPAATDIANIPTITLATGVAVSSAIEAVCGVQVGLKWVNDLIVDGRKLGGILCEMASHGDQPALVVGIGINICHKEADLPDDIRDKIQWLERLAPEPVDRNRLLSCLALNLENVYQQLLSEGPAQLLAQWRRRSVTLGQHVQAISGNLKVEGTAIDIKDSGALLLQLEDGTRAEINAGEVSIRMASGKYC